MAILLDTSVVLYLLKYPDRLGSAATVTLQNNSDFFVSSVSLWEIAIKMKADKLRVVLPISKIPSLIGAQEITITTAHMDAYLDIKLPQKDPFDTMLVAQSESEGMAFMTADKAILGSKYNVLDATK